MKAFYFKALFLVVLAVGVGAMTREIMLLSQQKAPPELLGFGPGFTGSVQLPASHIQAAFDRAQARMLEAFGAAGKYRLYSNLCYWLAFVASAAVTLILAWFGRAGGGDPPVSSTATKTMALPTTAVRVIAMLSAVAAILTAARTPFLDSQQQASRKADAIFQEMKSVRATVEGATTAAQAQAALDDLEYQSIHL